MDLTAPAGDTFPGTPRFQPLALLGRGSMGVVHRVFDTETETEVALKTFRTHTPEQLYYLKHEFRALSDVVHPNLVELFELIVEAERSFFTMEYVDGIDFVAHVRDAAASHQEIDEALQRFLVAAPQVVHGLMAVHGAGKLHRDVKPSNVLVARDGRVVLLDFGLATALDLEGPRHYALAAAGTLAYMAPEVVWGQPPTPAADWYSVGVMFYEALTGQLPFDGRAALLNRRTAAAPSVRSLNARVSEPLAALIGALLDPEPARRPPAEAILERLTGHAASPSPLPGRSIFVGRELEREQLREALARVERGATTLVQVTGPSGIGKSELLRRFLSAAEGDAEVLVFRGRCHPQEAIPYKAFDTLVDALSRFLIAHGSEADAVVPDGAAALSRLFPVLEQIPAFAAAAPLDPGAEPHEIRRRGFAVLRQLLGRLAARRRLILWIDDLQWSDLDSITLLRELLRPPEAPAMLVLLSYRSEDQASIPLLQELATETGSKTIALEPLDTGECVKLAQRLCALQQESDRRVADIVAEARGNPFFVGELARALASGQTPASLQLGTVILDRVQQLPDGARRLLEFVSVAGNPLTRSVVLEATGLSERGRSLVANLEKRALLRTTTVNDQIGVEIYHDRVREALLATLPADVLKERHGVLADVLLRQPTADAEALFRHCLGAQRREQAADWAAEAADRAAGALAFTRAAELYREALTLKTWESERAAGLQVLRADALVNAGHGAEAAPIYLDAAPRVPAGDRFDLRRRAAEQFLLSGHMDKGTAVVRAVLDEVGVRNPPSSTAALVGTVARIVPLWIRDTRMSRRAATRLSPAQLMRIDACHSAAKGLALVDPIRALYFAVLSLTLALRSGDPLRIALERASVGVALLPVGGPLARWAARLILDARKVAEASGDPYLLGFTAITMAQMRMVEARWREMLEFCDTASALLRQHCRGVTWELDICCAAATRALEELGEIREMAERGEGLLRETEETSNLYGRVNGLLLRGLGRLAQDDPAAAREIARRVRSLWTAGGFSMQSFYAFRLEAYCDLYEGRPQLAWDYIERTWPEIRRSGLLQHTLLRTDAYLLRARAAVANARGPAAARATLLRRAEADAQALGRQQRPDAVAHAQFIRAAVAVARGESREAVDLLQDAGARYCAVDMNLCGAYAQQCEAELATGASRTDLLTRAAQVFTQQAIVNPKRYLLAFAPGFA